MAAVALYWGGQECTCEEFIKTETLWRIGLCGSYPASNLVPRPHPPERVLFSGGVACRRGYPAS